MPNWRLAKKLTAKYWAYCVGAFFCLAIVALMAGACGAEWYREKTSGQFYDLTTSRRGNYFSYEIKYYIFHLSYDQIVELPSGVGVENSAYCDYQDSDCPAVMPGYDTTEFQAMYAAIFTFSLASIVTAIVLGLLLLFLNFRAESMPGLITKILTAVTITVSVILLAFLIITWGLVWRQPKSTRQAVGLPDSYCDQWAIEDQYKGGVYCSWQDEWDWNDVTIQSLAFYQNTYATGVKQVWGPTDGFILTTISLGFSAWVVLLTLGWRPAFFKN